MAACSGGPINLRGGADLHASPPHVLLAMQLHVCMSKLASGAQDSLTQNAAWEL